MDNPLVQPDPGLFIWTILTFLLLVILLKTFAWKPLLEWLEARQALIRTSLDDARKAREDLERLHADSARMLAEARGEAEAIISRTRTDAARFRDELREKAQAEAAGIVKNAERQIAMETARALQQIRHEAVDLSVAVASKILQRNVSKEDNERLIEDTFRELEATPRPN